MRILTLDNVTRQRGLLGGSIGLARGVSPLAVRNFASISEVGAKMSSAVAPLHVRPAMLEDLPEYQARHSRPQEYRQVPQFSISRERGFLPRDDPLVEMPQPFAKLDSLLKRMTVLQPQVDAATGQRKTGLLHHGHFGDAVLEELSGDDGSVELRAVDEAVASGDARLLSALFRDYCFAASAYLLEPVDLSYRHTGLYAEGRKSLPRQIAVPLKKLADALGHLPYMEYASSYALVNWRLKQQDHEGFAGRFNFNNLELIRAFQDAWGSEKGFILVHVEMVSFSGRLVSATEDAMQAAAEGDVRALEVHMERMLDAYRHIQASMETMWKRSKPEDYMKLRSFIFGTGPKAGNPMFPDGVVYEGVSDEPLHFRGESGANDNLVPLGDNFLQISRHHPDNVLTRTLRDFRTYRPKTHREYIDMLEHRANALEIRRLATTSSARTKALYILLVDQVREFRDRHWRFAKAYIISKTRFPLATGGSPMVAYLPQNLRTVLGVLDESVQEWSAADEAELMTASTPTPASEAGVRLESGESLVRAVRDVVEATRHQREQLQDEVTKLQAERAADALRGGMMDAEAASSFAQLTSAKLQAKLPNAGVNEGEDLGERKRMQRGAVGCDGVG